jgi:hypothetical protein
MEATPQTFILLVVEEELVKREEMELEMAGLEVKAGMELHALFLVLLLLMQGEAEEDTIMGLLERVALEAEELDRCIQQAQQMEQMILAAEEAERVETVLPQTVDTAAVVS